jgi:hypothetical protein
VFEKIITTCAGLKRWQIENKLWVMYHNAKSERLRTAIYNFAYNNNLALCEPLDAE